MMGYTEQDIRKMMACASLSIGRLNDNDIDEGLVDIIDLLQGLLEEGRV